MSFSTHPEYTRQSSLAKGHNFIEKYKADIDIIIRNLILPKKMSELSKLLPTLVAISDFVVDKCREEGIDAPNVIQNIHADIFKNVKMEPKIVKLLWDLKNYMTDLAHYNFSRDANFSCADHDEILRHCSTLTELLSGLLESTPEIVHELITQDAMKMSKDFKVQMQLYSIAPKDLQEQVLTYLEDRYQKKIGYLFTPQFVRSLPEEIAGTLVELALHYDNLVKEERRISKSKISAFFGKKRQAEITLILSKIAEDILKIISIEPPKTDLIRHVQKLIQDNILALKSMEPSLSMVH